MAINAQIDTSIPGSVRGMRFSDSIGDAVSLANMLDDRKRQREEYDRKRIEYETNKREEDAVGKIFRNYMNPDGSIDKNGLLSAASQFVRPHRMMELQGEIEQYEQTWQQQRDREYANQIKQRGREGLQKFHADTQNYNQAQNQMMPEPGAGVVGPPTKANIGARNANDLIRNMKAPKLPMDVIQAGAYDPGIKNVLDYNERLAKRPDSFGKTPTGLDLKYANDPEYVQSQMEILDGFYKSGKISEETLQTLLPVVQTRPVSWMSQLPNFLKSKEEGAQLGLNKTQEEIDLTRLKQEQSRTEIEKGKREEDQKAELQRKAQVKAKEFESNLVGKIDRLVSNIQSGKTRTGMTANAWAKWVTSSDAATQKAIFDQIKNELTVQKLLDIKSNGGTFGALSEKELELLERSASNLDFAGSKERNIAALNEIKNTINAAKSRGGNGAAKTSSGNRFTWQQPRP